MNAPLWKFSLYHRPNCNDPHLEARAGVLADGIVFEEVVQVLKPFTSVSSMVIIPENAPELAEALAILNTEGLQPAFQKVVTPQQRGKYFPVWRTRPDFSLDSSNWLELMGAPTYGGEIVAEKDGDLIIRPFVDSRIKSTAHCQSIYECELAVSEDFKKAFEGEGLVGAIFRPITYEPKVPKCKRQYWIDTDIVAPWSLYPRRINGLWKNGQADPDTIGIELGHTNELLIGKTCSMYLDDHGYDGLGNAYRRAEMDKLEGIDFMRQAEWRGQRKGVWRSYHIVSQRFRTWAKKFGCRFLMNGVKLMD